MKNIQHNGVEYTIHYPGHIMFSMLEEIGFEGFVGTLQELGDKKKSAKIDPLKAVGFCSKIFYWGVKGGEAFKGQFTDFSEDDARDVMFPALLSGDGELVGDIMDEIMSSWPQVEGGDEPKKPKKSKAKA